MENFHKSYFEGVLQLRNHSKELESFVRTRVEEDKRAFISQEKKTKDGIDLYFTSQSYLRALGKKIKEKFEGELKVTATLHTKSRTGEDLYRITVLFRMYPIKKGDVIKLYDEEYRVEYIGKKIFLKSVKSGKKIHISFEELKHAR